MLDFKLSQEGYQEYIACTKGNNDLTIEQAEFKLNRNIKRGHLVKNDLYVNVYQYGTLVIEVVFGEITSVRQARKWMRVKKKECINV